MLKEIVVPDDMLHKWLYYETGFEQLHPKPDIVYWMSEQGYIYNLHWKLHTATGKGYWIDFPNDEIAALFLMKWS
jgi:hypothetical protein